MVVSNLGSIILALPSSAPGSTTANVAHQVRLLALANTLSRLAIGPIADALAPVAARRADGVWAFARARTISRVVFMIGSAALLAVTCAWLASMVRSQETVWPLSIGTGVAYGSVFTVLCVFLVLDAVTSIPAYARFQARHPVLHLRHDEPRAQLWHHLVHCVRWHDRLFVPVRVHSRSARCARRRCLHGNRVLARNFLDLVGRVAVCVYRSGGALAAVESAGMIAAYLGFS